MTKSLTRRSFVSLSAATLASSQLRAQSSAASLVYIGSTTKAPGDGIHVAQWQAATGTLTDVRVASEAISPSFLAFSGHGPKHFLFAGHQSASQDGLLSSFQIAPSGDLTLINTITVPQFDWVHTILDRTGRSLISASYGSGKVLSCKIAPDGHLSDPVSQFQLTGHGPIASRQKSPHAHGVAVSPDNRFIYINDLGTDRIMVYKLNPATAELTAAEPPFFTAAPGSGPRHLNFHPNGKWGYSINELDSTITQLGWDTTTGALTQLSNTPTLPPGGDVANNRAGEVVFDRSGRFLYACNRGAAEELLVYAIAPNGHLTLAQRLAFGGKEARHFAISPDGKFLLVTEQFTNVVSVFARNAATGELKSTGARYPVTNPTCILFA